MTSTKRIVGKSFTIKAGTRVIRNGVQTKQKRTSVVTVREVTKTRGGNTKIIWKSMGRLASTVI